MLWSIYYFVLEGEWLCILTKTFMKNWINRFRLGDAEFSSESESEEEEDYVPKKKLSPPKKKSGEYSVLFNMSQKWSLPL